MIDGGGGNSGTTVDPECHEACVAKGVDSDECDAYCSKSADKGGASSGTKSGSAGATTSAGPGATGATTGGLDVEGEKTCIECWEEQSAGSCAAPYEACEESLACVQLRNCPFSCIGKESCLEECNEIIPSGVPPLSALVQCMMCGAGVCAAPCAGSIYQAYCR